MNALRYSIWKVGDDRLVPALSRAAALSYADAQNRSDAWFKWKFQDSPFGPALLAYAETNQSEIAGVVAFGRYQLVSGSSTLSAALSYDTFVHPDFRGAGLFSMLLERAVAEAKEQGIETLFNFPNAMSLPGFLKKEWTRVDCIRSFVRIADWVGCLRAFSLASLHAPFVPDRIQAFNPADLSDLENLLRSTALAGLSGSLTACRTPAFLKWRFGTYPMFHYSFVSVGEAWAIVRHGFRGRFRECQLMDLLSPDPMSSQTIRDLCRDIQGRFQPHLLSVTLSTAHPAFSGVMDSGFFKVPNHINYCHLPLTPALSWNLKDFGISATEFHTY